MRLIVSQRPQQSHVVLECPLLCLHPLSLSLSRSLNNIRVPKRVLSLCEEKPLLCAENYVSGAAVYPLEREGDREGNYDHFWAENL